MRVVVLVLCTTVAFGQPKLKFDVASVKPCDHHEPQTTNAGTTSPGRVHFNCSSLTTYVRQAMHRFAPELPLLQPMTEQEQFDQSIAEERLVARLAAGQALPRPAGANALSANDGNAISPEVAAGSHKWESRPTHSSPRPEARLSQQASKDVDRQCSAIFEVKGDDLEAIVHPS